MFRRLAEVAEVSKLSREERIKYDHALKRYRDTFNTIEGAKEKGRAEGMEENKRENARRMKADNMSAELIAKYTGLTVDTINSL